MNAEPSQLTHIDQKILSAGVPKSGKKEDSLTS